MRNSPFGMPESAVDRLIREERERSKLYRDVLGGGVVGEALRQVNDRQKLLRGLDFDKPYRGILDTLGRDRTEREAFKGQTSTAWALSVTETARSIASRNTDLVEQQRRLSSTVLETMRVFDVNRTTIGTALAAARGGDAYRRMVSELLPRVTGFSAIAERMRMVDIMTLRASDGVIQSATVLAAEMVLETQRIAEAIAAAPTDDESVVLFGELFEKIAAFVDRLGPNTIAELNSMGLVQWTGWLFGFLGLVLAIVAMQPAQSPEEKAAIVELNQKYEVLHEETRRLGDADAHASEGYLAGLPRAVLSRDAIFRRKPERAGETVLEASEGEVVAIAKAQGRWRLVVFRDPLSHQLAQAWVYQTALTPLAQALPQEGE